MHIHPIATRIIDRLNHRPGDVTLDHPYRRRWWLPVIGPTATVLLDHLTAIDNHDWQIHDTADLATNLGLGHAADSTPLSSAPSTGSAASGSEPSTSNPATPTPTPASPSGPPSDSSPNEPSAAGPKRCSSHTPST